MAVVGSFLMTRVLTINNRVEDAIGERQQGGRFNDRGVRPATAEDKASVWQDNQLTAFEPEMDLVFVEKFEQVF
jgi:hypothetical protein